MQMMNVQPYRMAETPQCPPVTTPSFKMAKIKLPESATKKGMEAGAALLTAGAAALTGQVLVNKPKRVTVNEIVNDSLSVLNHELTEMPKEELKVLDARCDETINKCNEYSKNKCSGTVEMYRDLLEDESSDIKQQLASRVFMDISDFYKANIGDPDEPYDTDKHVDYLEMNKEERDNLSKQMDNFIEECDKYAYGSVSDEIKEYKTILQDEKKAIEYLPKIDTMSFEELYSIYDGSDGVLGEAVFYRLLNHFYDQFDAKKQEIKKMCANYDKGVANYLHATGNQKTLIGQEMLNKYGPRCLEDFE